MGRKKIPTALKVAKGTHRPCRENPDEPMLNIEIPQAPKFLTKYAMEEWGEITQLLYDQGILALTDKTALAGYCQLYGRWRDAEEKLGEGDLTIETIQGNLIQNPLLSISNSTYKLMQKALIEFGMTPAQRPKIVANKKKKEIDPWAAFGKV